MEHDTSPGQMTDDQWNLVQQTVRDEANKIRVAASFLPRNGPWDSETDSVPTQDFNNEQPFGLNIPGVRQEYRLAVNDRTTRPLTTISVNVQIRNAQMAQSDFSSALSMFRRAANIIGRIEDGLIFGGQTTANPFDNTQFPLPDVFHVSGGEIWRGLINASTMRGGGGVQSFDGEVDPDTGLMIYTPDEFVRDITRMISELEEGGYLPPFALVLGTRLFELAHTPTNSLVMPTDRIKPILNGPLLRSSAIRERHGILLSLAGDPVDLVLASDISVKFIQVTMEPRHIYRVSQRMTLRIKQPGALRSIQPE